MRARACAYRLSVPYWTSQPTTNPCSIRTAPTHNKNTQQQQTEADKDLDARWRRIVANDLENIPIGLIILWAAGMAVSAKASKAGTGVIVLTILFTIFRFAFTYTFMRAIQPWRTVVWMGAILCVVIAALLGVVVAFQAQYGE